MNFRLLNNLVAITEDKSTNKTASGIVLADSPDGLLYGTVVAVGAENGESAPTLQVGDKVFLPRMAVRPMMILGNEYILVDEISIFGVVTDGGVA